MKRIIIPVVFALSCDLVFAQGLENTFTSSLSVEFASSCNRANELIFERWLTIDPDSEEANMLQGFLREGLFRCHGGAVEMCSANDGECYLDLAQHYSSEIERILADLPPEIPREYQDQDWYVVRNGSYQQSIAGAQIVNTRVSCPLERDSDRPAECAAFDLVFPYYFAIIADRHLRNSLAGR